MPRKKTHQEFINEMREKRPEVIVLGKYIDAKTKILCYCTISKTTWSPTPDSLLRGKKCPTCALKGRVYKRRKPHEQFIKEMSIKHPNLIVNEEYKGAWIKISCICTICNTTTSYYPANLLFGEGCWTCGNRKIGEKLSMKLDTFLSKLSEVNSNITYRGNFINASEHVDVKCNICGHEWAPVAKSLLHGYGCPICNQSHGEKEIDKYLHNHNIEHAHQKEFDGLIGLGGGNLSYDFYLPKYNLLIEYQGEFHDNTAEIQTEEDFLKQQEHDYRKKEYTIEHSIQLLEIWYYDFDNITTILDEFFTIQND
jgi:hypothetical protein